MVAKARPRWMNPTRRSFAAAGYRNWRRRRQPRTDDGSCAAAAPPTLFWGRFGCFWTLGRHDPDSTSFSAFFSPYFSTKTPIRKQNRFLAPPVGIPKTSTACLPWRPGKKLRFLTRFTPFFSVFSPVLSTSPASRDPVCVSEPALACFGVTVPVLA